MELIKSIFTKLLILFDNNLLFFNLIDYINNIFNELSALFNELLD